MHILSTITMLLVICLFITPGQCYSTSNQLLQVLADSGRKVFYAISNPFSYTIIYPLAFNNTPVLLITLASMNYCPSDPKEAFDLVSSSSVAKTNAWIEMQWANSGSVVMIAVNYFAFDLNRLGFMRFYQTNLKIYDTTALGNNDKQSQDSFDANLNLDDPRVYFLCFIEMVKGVKVTGATYTMYVTCSKKSNHEIKVVVRSDEDYGGFTENILGFTIGTKYFTVNTIAIIEDNIELEAQSLVASSTPSSEIEYNTSSPAASEVLMIGLRQFELSSRCLNFVVTDNNKQVTSGTILEIVYDYFLIVRKPAATVYLAKITSEFYSNQVFLYYRGFLDNSTQPSDTMFDFSSYDVIQFDNGENGNATGQYKLNCIINKAATNNDITVSYKFCQVTQCSIRKTVFRIITVTTIALFVEQKVAKIIIVNARNASESNFIFNTARFTFLNVSQSGDNSVLYLAYISQIALGVLRTLHYIDPYGKLDDVYMDFFLPKLYLIETSTKDNKIKASISGINKVPSSPTSQFQLIPSSNFTTNLNVEQDTDVFVTFEYKIAENFIDGKIQLKYVWNNTLNYEMKIYEMKVMNAIHLNHTATDKIYELVLTNLQNFSNISTSQFTADQPGVTFKSVSINGTNLTLQMQIDESIVVDNIYNITFSPSNSQYKVLFKDIMTTTRFKNFSSIQYQNNLDIYLENPNNLTQSTLPKITGNNRHITFKNISIADDNTIFIEASYNGTVQADQLEISYIQNTDSIYLETFSFKLSYLFPLVFCTGDLDRLSKIYYMVTEVVQYAYLGMFAIAIVFMNKLAGIEMMFLIQFSYYSLIIIGVYCPYVGLASMKYVSGYNPLFADLQQQTVKYNLNDLGIRANFLSNVNVMIFILGVCPVMFGILTVLGNKSDCYKKKPRYLKYGKAFLFEVPLTILLFSSFNIYTSLVVQIQYYDNQSVISLVIGVITALMLPLYALIYYFFKNQFSQFRQEFQTSEKIGPFTRETSIKIRQGYPLLIIFQFIIFPLLVSIESISSYCLYIALVVTLFGSVYTMVATPYLHKLDNLRLLVHRLITVLLVGCQIMFNVLAQRGLDNGGFIYYIPMVLLGILILGLLVDGANVVRISIMWIRKRGVIDHSLKMAKQSTKIKPVLPHNQANQNQGDQKWYPRLQFGQFKREQMAGIRRNPKFQFIMQENLLSTQEEDSQPKK